MESQPVPGSKIVVKSRSIKRRKKKCEKRAGAGERHFSRCHRPFPKSRASYFRSARFNTSPPYYLRAWHRLMESRILGFGIRNTLKEFGIPLTIGFRNPLPGQNPEFKTVLESPLTWGDFLLKPGCKENHFYSLPFGQAEASIYQPRRHFNQPQKRFDQQI